MEKKVIEEVIIRKKNQGIKKEKLSERVNNELLKKKRRYEANHQYLSAQKLVKNYREKQKSHTAYKYRLKTSNKVLNLKYDKTKEHLPIIIIRICGQWERIPKEIQLILAKFHLKELNNAIILFYNMENFKMVKLIESYVTWGYINKYLIEDLLRKRGSVTLGNNEPNELDNVAIENSLGRLGIVCIEDIIFELTKETKNAKDVLNYLGYFKLEKNDDGFDKANISFEKGGAQGFRGDKINELLKKMI